ncbi:MAG: Holliday junction resolvase RuvX [Solirubrobacterales bacterium]
MRVLALDPGAARCGCAISDPTGVIARPLPVIEPPDPRVVAALVAEHSIDVVVVGLPVGLSGKEGAEAGRARAFRDDLANLVDVPVETYDETLTTKLAQRTARSGAGAAEDSIAAAHILESYLQARAAGQPGEGEDGEEERS